MARIYVSYNQRDKIIATLFGTKSSQNSLHLGQCHSICLHIPSQGTTKIRPALVLAASILFLCTWMSATSAQVATYYYIGHDMYGGNNPGGGLPAHGDAGNITGSVTLDLSSGLYKGFNFTAYGYVFSNSIPSGCSSFWLGGFDSSYHVSQWDFECMTNASGAGLDTLYYGSDTGGDTIFGGGMQAQNNAEGGTWIGPLYLSPKNLGSSLNTVDAINTSICTRPLASTKVGDPIDVATGNLYEAETDFVGAANTGLSLIRYYNSQSNTVGAFGAGWQDMWHRSLKSAQSSNPTYTRADGRQEVFTATYNGMPADTYIRRIPT